MQNENTHKQILARRRTWLKLDLIEAEAVGDTTKKRDQFRVDEIRREIDFLDKQIKACRIDYEY